MDWSRWPNFKESEFRCKHTGKCHMDSTFMDRLQRLRTAFGRPMVVTSGYRDASHPAEAAKTTTGSHQLGRAVDIRVTGPDAFRLVTMAPEFGFTGIGVQQKGNVRFIHLDDLPPGVGFVRPTIWSY